MEGFSTVLDEFNFSNQIMNPLKLPSLDYILQWESFEKFYRVAHMARVEVMISLANSIFQYRLSSCAWCTCMWADRAQSYNSIGRRGVKNLLVEKVSHKLLMYGILACAALLEQGNLCSFVLKIGMISTAHLDLSLRCTLNYFSLFFVDLNCLKDPSLDPGSVLWTTTAR